MQSALHGPHELLRTEFAYKRTLLCMLLLCVSYAISSVPLLPLPELAVMATLSLATVPEKDQEELIWLRNEKLKVGLSRSSGGAIAWISTAVVVWPGRWITMEQNAVAMESGSGR